MIDSRGSTAKPGTISPPGAVFVQVFRELKPTKSVKVIPNPYPARGGFVVLAGAKLTVGNAYWNSVESGKEWLFDALISYRRKCAKAKLVLTGYSQGAQVTADVIQSGTYLGHVIGVVLFGDPKFNGRDRRVGRGNPPFRVGVNGALGTRPLFKFRRIRSYCHANDPVCQNTANPIALTTWHKNYDTLGEPAEAARVVTGWG